jgi:hypothetical protein
MIRKHVNLLEVVTEISALLLPSLTPDYLPSKSKEKHQICPSFAVLPSGLKVKSGHSLFLTFSNLSANAGRVH